MSDLYIKRILPNEGSSPRNDGTPGSALYEIVFELSENAPYGWSRFFIQAWNRPDFYTSMHRPGIATTHNNRISLKGTTIEEFEKHHRDTLESAVEKANQQHAEYLRQQQEIQEKARYEEKQHRENITNKAANIKFDNTQREK